jgi:monoterpene epsilon-lactone hydrolase
MREGKQMSPANRLRKKILGRFFPSFDLPVAEQRAKAEKMAHFMRLPKGVTGQPVEAGGVSGEWFIPEGTRDGVLLYLHGGAYNLGSVNAQREFLSRLTKVCGVKILAIDYRLAPEHPFPAAVEDTVSAYEWLLEQEYAPARIVIAGDSAGGGLTLAALVALRDKGRPLPVGAVCLCPWTDLALTGASMRDKAQAEIILDEKSLAGFAAAYVGEEALTAPLVSPLYADLSGLPPLLVQVGTDEILLDDSLRMAQRAEAAGVEVDLQVWEGMFHVFHMFPFFSETREAVENIEVFVRGCVSPDS